MNSWLENRPLSDVLQAILNILPQDEGVRVFLEGSFKEISNLQSPEQNLTAWMEAAELIDSNIPFCGGCPEWASTID